MTVVDDPADPRLDDYRDLRDPDGRRRRESERSVLVAEGPVAVRRLLDSGRPVRSVLVAPHRLDAVGPLPDGVELLVADRSVLAEVCGFDVHRGVLAAGDRLPPPPVAEVLGATRVVVAEAVGDHENLGAMFRTAAALGIGGVLLDGRCADPSYRRAVRVSQGWSLCLPWARLAPLPDGLAPVAAAGHRTVALCTDPAAVPVDRAADAGLLDGPTALLVGAEGPGLSPATVAAADVAVRIPMAEGVDSLNVATALGVVAAFAAARAGWPGTGA